MARSRRKTTGTNKGGTNAATGARGGTPPSSAAFATAHEFVDKPAAGKAAASPTQAKAGTAAAGAAKATRAEAAPARAESTERAAVAASEDTAKAADRAAAAKKPPAPAAATETPPTPAADSAAAPAADEPAAAAHDPYPHDTAHPDPAAGHGAAAYATTDHHEGLHHDADHAEHERPGAAAIALMVLAGIIVVAVLTLWLAPKAAPHLPSGIARYLAPGQVGVEGRLGELEARLAAREAEAEQLLAAQPDLQTLEGRIDELDAQLAALGGPATDADARAGIEAATAERAELAGRVEQLESGLAGVRSEIDAMNQALAEGQDGEGPTNPELAAALAQLQSRVESLAGETQSARSSLAEELAALSARLDEALARADEAETARAEAEAEAGRAAAAAALNQALARLDSRFQRGEPYAEELGEVESLAGSTAPEPLSAAADTGVPSDTGLADGLSRVARQALAAAPREQTAEGPLEGVGDWFRAQVAGRPTVETAGDGVGAILSRIEARLEEGETAAAMAEAESLPEPSRAAIEPWLQELATRAAAAEALDEWRAGLGAAG